MILKTAARRSDRVTGRREHSREDHVFAFRDSRGFYIVFRTFTVEEPAPNNGGSENAELKDYLPQVVV